MVQNGEDGEAVIHESVIPSWDFLTLMPASVVCFLVVMTDMQEAQPKCTNAFQALGCILAMNVPLAKGNPLAQSKFKGQEVQRRP